MREQQGYSVQNYTVQLQQYNCVSKVSRPSSHHPTLSHFPLRLLLAVVFASQRGSHLTSHLGRDPRQQQSHHLTSL
jgi:hypothetical protein